MEVVVAAAAVSNKAVRFQIVCQGTRASKNKDPDFCPTSCNAGAATSKSLLAASPNVRSRPKRTVSKPAKYRDDSEDSDQQQQSLLKKRELIATF